jgi:hypothetical protein
VIVHAYVRCIYRLDVERDDTGRYAINVANDSGSCTIPMKVKVIGKMKKQRERENSNDERQ